MSRSLVISTVLWAGCLGEALPAESFLDRQRILGARIEADGASEVTPGSVATVDVLAWSPTGDPSVLVALCGLDPEALDADCPSDAVVADAKGRDFATPEDQAWAQENGLLGVLPALPVAVPVPDLGLGPRVYLPLDLVAWSPDEADERASVTMVVVDGSAPRNGNPGPPAVELDGERAEAALTLDRGAVVELVAAPAEAPERYTDPEEGEVEEIYAYRWYSDLGELAPPGLDLPIGAQLDDVVQWTLPEKAGTGVLSLVVRDGRGGMAWSTHAVTVR
jgi:hypothetical protein